MTTTPEELADLRMDLNNSRLKLLLYEGEIERLRGAILADHRFSEAPCPACQYNGPGYFQPDTHPCSAAWHAAIKARNPGNTKTAEQAARTALAKGTT